MTAGGVAERTGGGRRDERKRRRDESAAEELEDDDKRKLRFADSLGTHDINGNTWRIVSRDDAKVFHPKKGGEGGLVRVMKKGRVKRFILRALPSSSQKDTSLVHFLSEIHDEVESSSRGREGDQRDIMPQQFSAQWHIIRRMLGVDDDADDDNGILECLFLARFSAGNLHKVPLLMCAPKGATVPTALQKENWLTDNSVVSNLPPRTPEARQFLRNCGENLATFMTACWDEEFEGSLDPFLDALSGRDALAAEKMKEASDMFILLMFHGVFANWATAMWTQFGDEEILPAEAAERLREAMRAIIDDLLVNRWELYPHINCFGPDGRLQTIVSATHAESRRLATAEELLKKGGVRKQGLPN